VQIGGTPGTANLAVATVTRAARGKIDIEIGQAVDGDRSSGSSRARFVRQQLGWWK